MRNNYASHPSELFWMVVQLLYTAKFEYTAYSKLAAGKISYMGIFEFEFTDIRPLEPVVPSIQFYGCCSKPITSNIQ